MSDFVRKIKGCSVIVCILCIAFGVLICIWPEPILLAICRMAGVLIIVSGIIRLIVCIRDSHVLNKRKWF